MVDHSKFGTVSTALVAPLTVVHKIVTDNNTPPKIVHALEELGIEVLVA